MDTGTPGFETSPVDPVDPAPAELAIVSVVPSSGPTTGGTVVTVNGTFEPGTVITFGGTAALVQSQTPTALQAITPAHEAGLVDVTVSVGTRSATLPNGFQYALDGDPPVLTGVTLVPTLDQVQVRFDVSEGDGSMDGGSLQVSDGVNLWDLPIPAGLAVWDPFGTSTGVVAPWAMLDCNGVNVTYTVTAIDADGRTSAPVTVPLVVEGFGVLPEIVGDHAVSPTADTWTACVVFDDATSLADDEDIAYTATASGSHTFFMGWEDIIDGDFSLRDGDSPATLLAYSAEYGDVWEAFTYSVSTGDNYLLQMRLFAAYAGEVPPFQAHVLVRRN